MRFVDREEWLRERMLLLKEEKVATRELDRLAKRRQELPWVRVEKEYSFDTSEGKITFEDLFGQYSQLIIYHFMFGPDWKVPCDGCTGWAAALNGTLDQITRHDANLVVVSRAPIERIEAAREAQGWTFLWASAFGSDFNYDFHMSADPDCGSVTVGEEEIFYDRGESGGINVFVRKAGEIFHTYSCHNRGIQQMNGAFGYVDLLPYGGN